MTNAEKFREVFGLPNGIEPLPLMCDIVECEKIKCVDCPMYDEGNGFWDKEYKKPESEDMGEVSDGYHTFNQLYHQRAVLFATIVNQNKDIAWKSFKHSDGKYCFDSNGEWFIVGVDTPQGSYTYHYEKKYWDMFDCEELECGKEWDGHTEEDVTRLLSLQQEKTGHWIDNSDGGRVWNPPWDRYICSNCGRHSSLENYCCNCGAYMEDEE